jgi:hypothetical protein
LRRCASAPGPILTLVSNISSAVHLNNTTCEAWLDRQVAERSVGGHPALRRVVSEGRGGFSHGSAYFIAQGRIGYSPRECHTTRQECQERDRLVTANARTAFQPACDAVQDLSENFFEEGASLLVSSCYVSAETLEGAAVAQVASTPIAHIELHKSRAPALSVALLEARDSPSEVPHPCAYSGAEGIGFGLEVRVEGARGHTGLLGQRIDSNAAETMTAKTTTGAGQDLGSTGLFSPGGMGHGNNLHVTNPMWCLTT